MFAFIDERRGLFTPLFARLFIPFGLGYFASVILGSANAVMSPILITTFSLSPANLGFMSSVYLIAFGLAQFPLGVLLDRYGARRTLAPFLLFAVAGAGVFAISQNIWHLILSRALVGVGLSGCLMASFKAYAQWLPQKRLPFVYSLQSLMGGIGGMVATRPFLAAIELMHWRTCFWILSALMLLCAAGIWFLAPKDAPLSPSQQGLGRLLADMLKFLKDGRFWLAAPVATAAQAVMFAYLYLWVGPWMRDVAGMDEAASGVYMLYAFAGMAAGYFLNGILADFFKRWLSWEQLYLCSGALLTLTLGFIALNNSRTAAPLWAVVAFLAAMTMISFPIMRGLYKDDEIGRAFTLLNFMIFLASFITQWLIGIILNFYPIADGHFSKTGYQTGLWILTALNLAAVVHLYLGLKKLKNKK